MNGPGLKTLSTISIIFINFHIQKKKKEEASQPFSDLLFPSPTTNALHILPIESSQTFLSSLSEENFFYFYFYKTTFKTKIKTYPSLSNLW